MDAKQKAAYVKAQRLYELRDELVDRLRETFALLHECHPDGENPTLEESKYADIVWYWVSGDGDFDEKPLCELINEITSSLESD